MIYKITHELHKYYTYLEAIKLMQPYVTKEQMIFFSNYALMHGDQAMEMLEIVLSYLKEDK